MTVDVVPTSPSSRRSPLTRCVLLSTAAVLAVAGVLLVYANARNASEYVLRPVEVPLQMQAGERVEAGFVAELDGHYEVELEFLWDDPPETLREQVLKMDEPSTLDIRWSVTTNGTEIAAGTAQEYLYIRSASFKRRIHDRVLGIAPYGHLLRRTAIRGVGRFKAGSGKRYRVQATVGASSPELVAAESEFCVRINRQFWSAHCARTTRLAYTGFVALGGSFLSFACWALVSRRNKAR